MRPKASRMNPKGARNAEEQEKTSLMEIIPKEEAEKCTMLFVQSAEKKQRFHSNRILIDQFTAATVFRTAKIF